jgi:hypothetical protein
VADPSHKRGRGIHHGLSYECAGSFLANRPCILLNGSVTGSDAFFDLRTREPGWVKNQDLDPGSGMNIPDHFSERFKTILG